MTTRRTPLKRRAHRRITDEAIEAYRADDYMRLHHALGLKPWECSPLPLKVTPLGVDQGPPRAWERGHAHCEADWAQAKDLQRKLEKAARQ